ncbi:MAG: hypothetical protein KDA71_23685, partial [Planctomycetales bacterium]|nr:hypothetical protein [Planctomycetales bacterium]
MVATVNLLAGRPDFDIFDFAAAFVQTNRTETATTITVDGTWNGGAYALVFRGSNLTNNASAIVTSIEYRGPAAPGGAATILLAELTGFSYPISVIGPALFDQEGWTVNGSAGGDVFGTGNKNDLFLLGAGDDFVDAADGNDTVFGGAGNDTLNGGDGDDTLDGGDGDDTINTGAGDDYIIGSRGSDLIYSDNPSGFKTIDYSALMIDVANGETSPVNGDFSDTGASLIIGTNAADFVSSNSAPNVRLLDGDDRASFLDLPASADGGPGTDTIELNGDIFGISEIYLEKTVSTSGESVGGYVLVGTFRETLRSFENLKLGEASDITVFGSSADNVIEVVNGSGDIYGLGGDDIIKSGM